MELSQNNISCDSLFDGDLICYQQSDGYRFSVDAVLLAHFARVKKQCRILDLGAGTGIVSLLLLYRFAERIHELVAIEIQEPLVKLAMRNFTSNGFELNGKVFQGDICEIRSMVEAGSFDSVVMNPPYYPTGTGRRSGGKDIAVARHQIHGNIEDFLQAAAYSVKNGGDVYSVYPAERAEELFAGGLQARLSIKKIQFVYSYPQSQLPARLVLVHWRKNGGVGMKVQPPFYIYREKSGSWSSEMERCYRPRN